MARRAELAEIGLPDFGMPQAQPMIPAATYQARIAAALETGSKRWSRWTDRLW